MENTNTETTNIKEIVKEKYGEAALRAGLAEVHVAEPRRRRERERTDHKRCMTRRREADS